ncbi:hypothetical protein AKJ09_07373 [Labilithrix luteola]|uniref:Uncharacterized protein n=1 Tax=Labilithrix luteola TaxID=1391654 RepID=A0A0K1Q5Q2_9BACT|nr:hypothetical protein AKJ09_07373 [Labilithrix luteola]
MPRTATPVVIDESIKALEDQPTRERLERIMATPELQQTIRELAAATVPGFIDGLDSAESKARIHEFSKALVAALVEELRPAMREAVQEALSKDVQAQLDRMVADMAAQATHSVMKTAATDVPTTLSPAMRAALAENLGAPEVRSAAASTAHDIAKSALAGSREAILEVQQAQEQGPVQRMARFLTRAGILLAVFALLFIALVAFGMLSLRSRAIRAEQASEASAQRVRKLALLMLSSEGQAWSPDEKAMFQQELETEAEPRVRGRRPRPHA